MSAARGTGITGVAAGSGGGLAMTGAPIAAMVVVALVVLAVGLLLLRTGYVRRHRSPRLR